MTARLAPLPAPEGLRRASSGAAERSPAGEAPCWLDDFLRQVRAFDARLREASRAPAHPLPDDPEDDPA